MRGSEETVHAPDALDAPDDSTNFHEVHGVASRRCDCRFRRVVRWRWFAALPENSVRGRHDAPGLIVIDGELPKQVVLLGTCFRQRVFAKR